MLNPPSRDEVGVGRALVAGNDIDLARRVPFLFASPREAGAGIAEASPAACERRCPLAYGGGAPVEHGARSVKDDAHIFKALRSPREGASHVVKAQRSLALCASPVRRNTCLARGTRRSAVQ